MAKIERFEDLQSWQKSRQLANSIYDLTECQRFAKDFHLRGQIQDAAGSVMHNVAEGFDAGTNLKFIRFLKIARRSASEVQSELYLVLQRKVRVLRVLLMAFLPFSPSSPPLPPNGEGSLLSLWERERVRENWQGTIARPCAVMLALDRNYINQNELDSAYNLATETKRLINGMIACLRKSKRSTTT